MEAQRLIIRNELDQDNLQAFEQYKLRDDDAAPPALAPPLALPAPPAAQVINDEVHVDPLMGGDLQLYDDVPELLENVAHLASWYVRDDPGAGVARMFFKEGDEIPVGFVFDPDFWY